MELLSDSPDTLVATSLYLSGRFGDRTSLLVDKINALDLEPCSRQEYWRPAEY
jgi:hypothetical protein